MQIFLKLVLHGKKNREGAAVIPLAQKVESAQFWLVCVQAGKHGGLVSNIFYVRAVSQKLEAGKISNAAIEALFIFDQHSCLISIFLSKNRNFIRTKTKKLSVQNTCG